MLHKYLWLTIAFILLFIPLYILLVYKRVKEARKALIMSDLKEWQDKVIVWSVVVSVLLFIVPFEVLSRSPYIVCRVLRIRYAKIKPPKS